MIGFNLLLYFVVLAALAKPLGWYMARVYEGQAVRAGPRRSAGWSGCIYRVAGVDPHARKWGGGSTPSRCCCSTASASWPSTRCCDCRAVLPLNPQEFPGQHAGPGVQHGRQLCHEHQLAELRRRNDDELPVADARADGAELRLGGVRHGRAGGADSRPGAAYVATTIGNFWFDLVRSTVYILLPLSIVRGAASWSRRA